MKHNQSPQNKRYPELWCAQYQRAIERNIEDPGVKIDADSGNGQQVQRVFLWYCVRGIDLTCGSAKNRSKITKKCAKVGSKKANERAPGIRNTSHERITLMLMMMSDARLNESF